jgi:hypothetical protein
VLKRFYVSFVALALLATLTFNFPHTQALAVPASPADPLTILPASDAVVTVDVKRILNDALPKALAGDSAKMAEVNADIDKFKTKTGVDLRNINRLALGVRFTEAAANQPTKGEAVAIANGTFNAGAMVAAGRIATKGKYREEKHGGKTINVFTLNEQVKLLGLFNMRLSEVAVAALDPNTLAIGKLTRVREAIDSSAGRGRVNTELVQMATRNPNAILSFGANVPSAAMRELGLMGLDNDEITKAVSAIRQVYGSIGTTAAGFDMLTVARTENAEQAQRLSDTVSAAKEFAGMFTSRMSNDAKGKLVQNALDNLKVTAAGNELQLRLELAQADITTLVRGF